jgi:oligopeptidase B
MTTSPRRDPLCGEPARQSPEGRAPRAVRRPHVHLAHGDERVDDWYWLRDRDDPEVVAYLDAENAYTDAVMAPVAALQDALFAEIKGRIQETDTSAPVRRGEWAYYSRTVEGLDYPAHCRRRDGGDEQVLLDVNAEAARAGTPFYGVGTFELSPTQRLLAWSDDTTGDEAFTLRFRDLATGDDLPDAIPNTSYGVAWYSDDAAVLYTTLDEARRPWQVWRHRLGTPAADDELVWQEDDDRFWASVYRTKSGAWLVVALGSEITSEAHVLPAADPTAPPRVVEPRRQGVEYDVDHHVGHHGDRFLVVTNDGAPGFRLVEAPVGEPGRAAWRDVVPARDGVRLHHVEVFAGWLAVSERSGGLRRIRVVEPDGAPVRDVEMPGPLSTLTVGPNPEYESRTLRYHAMSLVVPDTAWDEYLATGDRTLVKRQPVLGGYDPENYETERVWATAADGTRVPISLAWRKGTPRDGSAPCLLYGYGSYETAIDPSFSAARLSLLDRGFVYAVAHVRGGGEMGRHWYEDGKLLAKRNTFTDFVACAEHLVQEGWTSPACLVARGRSAGGLLMGAVANLRPDLFQAIVAEVPFVDALTTILDETIPLTVIEWEEWGNPNDPAFYEYMKSYSPYDNVEPRAYPAMLVTGGLHDPRVAYWEPAKWVAKLRHTKTDSNPLLLRMEMGAGHMGPSGRYRAWREEAFVLAFVLWALGRHEM